MSQVPYLWTGILAACALLWAAGLRLFLRSGLSRARRLIWTTVLVAVGGAIGALLPLGGISYRFVIVLCAVPLLGIADVLLFRSGRPFSFWLRACGFEVCTVFAVAALVRMLLDVYGVAALIQPR
jgi:hypothetical protein